MSVTYQSPSSPIVKELIAAGIIPENCVKWALDVSANSVVVIRSEVLVTEEQFRKIADALLAHHIEAKNLQRTTFLEIGTGRSVTAE